MQLEVYIGRSLIRKGYILRLEEREEDWCKPRFFRAYDLMKGFTGSFGISDIVDVFSGRFAYWGDRIMPYKMLNSYWHQENVSKLEIEHE